jgi:hypothetical protein
MVTTVHGRRWGSAKTPSSPTLKGKAPGVRQDAGAFFRCRGIGRAIPRTRTGKIRRHDEGWKRPNRAGTSGVDSDGMYSKSDRKASITATNASPRWVSTPTSQPAHRTDDANAGRSPDLRVTDNAPAFPVSQWLLFGASAHRLQLRGQCRNSTGFPFHPPEGGHQRRHGTFDDSWNLVKAWFPAVPHV